MIESWRTKEMFEDEHVINAFVYINENVDSDDLGNRICMMKEIFERIKLPSGRMLNPIIDMSSDIWGSPILEIKFIPDMDIGADKFERVKTTVILILKEICNKVFKETYVIKMYVNKVSGCEELEPVRSLDSIKSLY